ncbi:hypothetical protein GGTG_11086 [Gaeumannomyces tritici R3-111a-1]|uniref:3-carboxymuconate cyclase n=1 Tax=Gaeumannomyces tritici (strain R3-111a-1) TaxID=644352 RepID=J3PC63_GAET3|nr:hypothetical protein GGTG_11086 [Gaeumannomyces tritici R3-111a-1]EJT71833.1 hypothetical protein GGTG_11086 [Gaeumannomyces tritici R3-111a-1]
MHVSALLLLALGQASNVLALPANNNNSGCGAPSQPGAAARNAKAVYTITNEKENAVVAIRVGQDGMLQAQGSSSTPTGGAGATGVDGDGKPAVPDALFSQSALTVAGSNLFAVNAGSNTLTMFAIDAADPTKLTMVGKPVAIPGEFPVTVAASKRNKLACVATTGAKAGVSCASFSAQAGLAAMDALRPFDLGQTTPPKGPTNTVSQVFFARDGKTLFATVKGDPPANKTGFLASFPVQAAAQNKAASLNAQGAQSSPQGTAVLFGSATIPGSRELFVTDASFGAAVLSVDAATGAATVKGKGAVDGQKATCWATINPATGTAFVTDVATNRLVEMSVKDASVMGQIDLSANGDPGLIDLQSAGKFVYALSPGNGTTQAAITVVDATTKKQVQHMQLQAMGVGKNSMGLALRK